MVSWKFLMDCLLWNVHATPRASAAPWATMPFRWSKMDGWVWSPRTSVNLAKTQKMGDTVTQRLVGSGVQVVFMFISPNTDFESYQTSTANKTLGTCAWCPSADKLCFPLWLSWTLSRAPFRAISKHSLSALFYPAGIGWNKRNPQLFFCSQSLRGAQRDHNV